MSEMLIWTMFSIVSMMRIIGVEILKKWKCAEQTAHSNSLKTREMLYTLFGYVGNDDLNYVCHS